MSQTMEEANAQLRQAVEQRLEAVAAGKPAEQWYDPQDDEQPWKPVAREQALANEAFNERVEATFTGRSLLREQAVHPTSQKYFDLLDTLRELHISKSAGYGCPDGTDPLLNIRRGAEFVGIPAWKGAMVRLCDKVTRLAVFNKTGNLPHESVEDNLMDLASYALLALLLHREDRDVS